VKSSANTIYEGVNRLSVAHLLAAIIVLFIIMPLADELTYGSLLESIAFSFVLLAAVSAVGGQRRALITAAALFVPALLARWLHHVWPQLFTENLYQLVAIVFVTYIVSHLFRFVITAPSVNLDVLCAAISIFLLYAVAWGFVYTVYADARPTSFKLSDTLGDNAHLSGFLALYFSMQVLTTITFGDVLPASNAARMMCLVEATTGVFYMATMIARLVGLYTGQATSRDSSG
jgi:hypothetical protein